MPAAANGAPGTDGELIVIDGDVAYNFWQFNRKSATTASAASFGAENIVTGDGWGTKSPFLSAGITAVGASMLGGLLVKDEVADGSIDHALQLVVDSKLVLPGFTGNAIAGDGGSANGIVQEGQLLAIPPGTPMPAGLSALGQQVFTAMQKYGAYVVDVAGGTTNIRAQANAFDDATITALWHDMGKITPLLAGVSGGSGNGSGSSGGGTTPTDPTTPGADTTAPTIQWVATSGTGITNGNGTIKAGGTVHLTLKLNEVVTVSGTPTLSLNSNGTATYVSGSGTDTLQFDYKVGAGQNAADLEISGFNLSGVKDLAGNVVNTTGAPHQPGGTLVIGSGGSATTPTDTTPPTIQWVATSGTGITNGNGTVKAGGIVHLTLKLDEVVTVSGTPTLLLNSKGTANYVSGSGTDTLQFDYKVGAGQNAADLEISGFNLSGVKDLAGNVVNTTGAPHQPGGTLVIGSGGSATTPTDTTPPTIQWVAANGPGVTNGNGTVGNGGTVRLTLNFSEAVKVTGTPTLALNSNGTAKYVSGSGTNTLQFDYKVGAGQSAADLAITGFNLGGIKDLAGNSVNLAGAPTEPAGTLVIGKASPINPAAPTIQWVAANGPGVTNGNGTVGVGGTVRLTLNFSETVNVTGTPTLALNSNGTAKYVSGSGTNNLQFDYKVAAGQNAADLEITGFNLGGVKNKSGTAVNTVGAPHQPAGTLVIGTGAPLAATATKLSASATTSTTDLASNPVTTSDTGLSTNGTSSVSSLAGSASSHNTWSKFSNQISGATGLTSGNTTLGFAANSNSAGHNLPAADGSFVAKMALLSQYAASSFDGPRPGSVGQTMQNGAIAELTQTLANPHHR